MHENEFYCLIVGSRTFNDYSMLCDKVDKLLVNQLNKDIVIVSGGAKGADALAEQYAKDRKYKSIVMPANWDLHGKSAGFIRNKEMHEFIAKFPNRGVIAFWDGISKGTAHSFELSKTYNNPLKVIRFK